MKIAAHSAYDMFSWYKYLIVDLVFFSTSVFGVGIFLDRRTDRQMIDGWVAG